MLDRSVLPTQVQIGALLLLLRLLWLPDLSERLQLCCVLLSLLCSAVLERQKRSEFEFGVPFMVPGALLAAPTAPTAGARTNADSRCLQE